MIGAILIATLGTEPQVVTLTLDALLAADETITRVVVVHTQADSGPDSPIAGRTATRVSHGAALRRPCAVCALN